MRRDVRHGLRALLAVAALELRVQRRDLSPAVVLTVMPVVLAAFLIPTYERVLETDGAAAVTGVGQAMSGLAVMSSLLLMPHVGFVFYRDHGWNTWSRYLGADISVRALVAGKLLVPLGVLLAQFTVLLVTGVLLFGLRVRGSWAALALVVAGYAVCLLALAFLGVALCRSIMQLATVANVLALALSGVGGALVPLSTLPGWARQIAPAVPSYWGVQGMQKVFGGGGVTSVTTPVLMLLAFTAAAALVAAALFRPNERKVSWS
jgi:ABC-2 type transport system permease protein